jgi:SAM-dependent methyltransferase
VPETDNVEQRDYWNGDDSREWSEHPDHFDGMLAPFSEMVLERVAPAAGEHVLDVGCGNGALTLDAARRVGPDGAAVGVDLSEPMLENARRRAHDAGATNVRFEASDAQVGDLGGPHDVVVSRFGVMFFADPDAAFANVASALAPAARLQVACWAPAPENDWVAVPMAAAVAAIGPPKGGLPEPDEPGPFRYADPGPLLDSLEGAGFADAAAERVDTTVLLAGRGTFEHVLEFLAGSAMFRSLLGEASAEERAEALAAIGTALRPYATEEGVRIGAAVWLVSARRR